MTEAIDSAFTDRADIKMLINPPHEIAIYTILRAAIEELIKVNKNYLSISKYYNINNIYNSIHTLRSN